MWKIPAMLTKTRGGGQYFDMSTFHWRELDPYSVTYRYEEGEVSDSYVPKRVATQNPLYCFCGLQKSRSDDACTICSSNIMQPVKEVWLMVEQSHLY